VRTAIVWPTWGARSARSSTAWGSGARSLEDILDPNRNVDEAFRTTMVTTNDGRVISGLKLREEGSDLVLADSTGKEVRIAAADIDEVAVSHLSPMASNMLDQIGEQNLPDLLAYLMQHSARP
jgi:putative heme-binding domain-containing protein